MKSVGVEIRAVAEISGPRRAVAKSLVPSARVYASQAELLSREKGSLDALIVATPPLSHANAVRAGLAAGLHVLCEKPLTLDPNDYAAIASLAAAADRCVYAVNNWAFSPQWSRLLEIAASGRLGPLRHAEIRVLRTRPSVSVSPADWRKDPARSGGGVLVDHGWHGLYLLRRLLGDELDLAETELHPGGGVDEAATLNLRTPGASGTLHLSWRAPERSNFVLAAGEKGSAELRDDRLLVKAEGLDEQIRFSERLSAGSAHPDWLAAMWPTFAAECRGQGRGRSLDEAGFCLKTIRAAYGAREAAALG